MKNTTKDKIRTFFMPERGRSKGITDLIIGLVIGAILLFNLFESWYSAYILANATTGITAGHSALLGVQVIMVFIGFLLVIYKFTRGKGR